MSISYYKFIGYERIKLHIVGLLFLISMTIYNSRNRFYIKQVYRKIDRFSQFSNNYLQYSEIQVHKFRNKMKYLTISLNEKQ